MGAIKAHKTAVDKNGKWDGPKAVASAPNDAKVLRYMHAWVNDQGDAEKKSSYKFPHHAPGTDTAAVIAGVNNALARLPQANIPGGDRSGVEKHLRAHRKDAGLEEALSEAEVAEAMNHIRDVDDLKKAEADQLAEALNLREKSNLGEWLESRLHLTLTQIADDLFGGGNVTRDERKALSGAIGAALDVYHQFLADNAPQVFLRRPWDDAPEQISEAGSVPDRTQHAAPLQLRETRIKNEFTPLVEKAVGADGTIPIKLIQPGWGSSGYYPKEVLDRDGAKAFPAGTKMFWNHPTRTEESDRPERDLNDLAAELTSEARYDEKGAAGPGLYAKAKVFQGYVPAVDDLAESIGLSIRASGKAVNGSAEGKSGPIISELTPDEMNTVDFVTYPGAGGEILTLFEAARAVRADTAATSQRGVEDHHEEDDMVEVEKLTAANATLQKELDEAKATNAKQQEALILREAKDTVTQMLAKSGLPEVTKARLVESLARSAPVKDGKLDVEAFDKLIQETVRAEVKYLTEAAGLGEIKGLGESGAGESEEEEDDKLEESLEGSFKSMGMSEKKAKLAAKGRE